MFKKVVFSDGRGFVDLEGDRDGSFSMDVGNQGQCFRLVNLTTKDLFDLATMLAGVPAVAVSLRDAAALANIPSER